MRVPLYDRTQRQQPVTAPRADYRSPALEAMERFGRDLTGAADNIAYFQAVRKKEQDTADVLTAVTLYSDEARTKLDELVSRKGVYARGTVKEYSEWAEKTVSKYSDERLFNDDQRRMFQKTIITHRASDLDALTRHQRVEHESYKQQTSAAFLMEIGKEITANPFNEDLVENAINRYHAAMVDLFPGENIEAVADKTEAALRKAALLSMIDQDPGKAQTYLEKWKDQIEIADYVKYKGVIEGKVAEGVTNAAYLQLKGQFSSDLNGAIDYLYDEKNLAKIAGGIDVQQQQYLIGVLQKEAVLQDQEKRQKAERTRDQALNQYAGFLRQKNVKGAMDFLKSTTALDDVEKLRLESDLAKERSGTDPALLTDIMNRIKSGDIRYESEIMIHTGRGITENDEQFLKKYMQEINTDPGQKFYLDLSEKYFDENFKGTDFYPYKTEFLAELNKQITGDNPESKKLKGEQILNWSKQYLGNVRDIADPWFWQEGGTEGDILKSPYGKRIREIKKGEPEEKETPSTETKRAASTFKIGAGGEAIATSFNDIPDDEKQQIAKYLKSVGKALTESNFMKVYQYGKRERPSKQTENMTEFIIEETGERLRR